MSRKAAKKRIGFYVFKNIHIPHHLREYYAGIELEKTGWEVEWLLPISGKTSDDLKVDWPIVRYRDCNFRGHKIFFPIYFGCFLRKRGIETLWISGWAQRDPDALCWFVKILKLWNIGLVYDTVDPIEMFNDALCNDELRNAITENMMRKVYDSCDLILTVTPEIKKIMELNGVDERKIFSCRWGTDISVFRQQNMRRNFRKEICVSENTFLVGWLGSMSPFKGLKEIILPLLERCTREFSDVHFVLAGYGILEDELKRWVRERPDMPITIFGRVPYREAASFTGSLDAYLVPSNPNSDFAQSICPVKCFDGLAMGVDVLVTKTKATEFLSDLSCLAHLCEFTVESFLSKLKLIMANKQEKKIACHNFTGVNHQTVSKDICSLINTHFAP